MSKQQRYTEEFKLAAVKQVTERHYPVAEVAERLGVSSHSLYALNRPHFPRHLKSLKLRSFRRCYEQAATLHGRIQTGRRQAGD